MSEVATIQAGVDGLIKAMLAKGLVKPDAEYHIIANSEGRIHMSWVKEAAVHDWDRNYSYHKGAFEQALPKAQATIAGMADLADRNKAAFLSKLDEVIAMGRKTGIEVDFVNPLVETMKRLSENIITHQKADA